MDGHMKPSPEVNKSNLSENRSNLRASVLITWLRVAETSQTEEVHEVLPWVNGEIVERRGFNVYSFHTSVI